jgi:hypothetical protein
MTDRVTSTTRADDTCTALRSLAPTPSPRKKTNILPSEPTFYSRSSSLINMGYGRTSGIRFSYLLLRVRAGLLQVEAASRGARPRGDKARIRVSLKAVAAMAVLQEGKI